MDEESTISSPGRYTVDIGGMAYGGEAVGRVDGQVIFVPYVLPGERVVVDVEHRKKKFLRARPIDVLERAESRIAPPCPYFRRCGGCQWQHVDYAAQLGFKHAIVVDQLQRIGGFAEPLVHPTLGSPDEFHYRNNARFTLKPDGRLGFTEAHSQRFLQIDYCYLMHARINEVLEQLQDKVEAKHQVVIRHGLYTDDLLVHPALPEAIAPFPTGQESYREQLCGREFRVSAMSFFQVNTRQAERMAGVVDEYLNLQGDEVLLDAYSGVGTFSLILAGKVRRSIGIEEGKMAVADAMFNSQDVPNAQFYLGKTEHVLPGLDEPVDIAVLDPARVGCHPDVLDALMTARPRRIVYVSCDPSTLARDLKILCDEHYRLVQVQPLDMFPQTYHIECVAQLERV